MLSCETIFSVLSLICSVISTISTNKILHSCTPLPLSRFNLFLFLLFSFSSPTILSHVCSSLSLSPFLTLFSLSLSPSVTFLSSLLSFLFISFLTFSFYSFFNSRLPLMCLAHNHNHLLEHAHTCALANLLKTHTTSRTRGC